MKSILLATLITGLLSFQCNKAEYDAPSCIEAKIARLKAESKANPPAQVDEYIYNGKKVYLFNAPCCDQYSELYDESCNLLCAPYGGISGHGDGKCADFSANAQHVRVIWKDSR
ncbi:MAG: hypothetical protein U0U70_01225 [Chitinophagaceae bacterium]